MHPDREAFVAGIAADPGNDLRRLVFADWLEENGEPERAEFVRLQIEATNERDAGRKAGLHARTRELFDRYRTDWFGLFVNALEPGCRFDMTYGGGAVVAMCSTRQPDGSLPFVRYVNVMRGFVAEVGLNLAEQPSGSSIGAALRLEPIPSLSVVLSNSRHEWERFSEPALRHVETLVVREIAPSGSLTAAILAFTDSHLAGVRTFGLQAHAQHDHIELPIATTRAFANSPLAYRLEALTIRLNDDGLRVLSRSDRLRLHMWTISGSLTAAGVRPLTAAMTAPSLRALHLRAELDDTAVAALARGERFAKLTELDLSGNRFSDAGLRALAVARFLPQLEVLDISGCDLGDPDSAPGLRALADALNPDRLKRLRVSACGFDAPPAFLAERFGSRVTV